MGRRKQANLIETVKTASVPNSKKPLYIVIQLTIFGGGGILGFGALLSSIDTARTMITPPIAAIGIIMAVAVAFSALLVRLTHKRQGRLGEVAQLLYWSNRQWFAWLGVVFLLCTPFWLPSSVLTDTKKPVKARQDPHQRKLTQLLNDSRVQSSIKQLLGDEYETYNCCMKAVTSSKYDTKNRVYVYSGYMPGIDGSFRGFVAIGEPTGLYVAITDDGETGKYYTNDNSYAYTPPDFLMVDMESIYWKPCSLKTLSPASRAVDGNYTRDGSQVAESASIEVTRKKDGNIRIYGFANYGGRTGEIGDEAGEDAEEYYKLDVFDDHLKYTEPAVYEPKSGLPEPVLYLTFFEGGLIVQECGSGFGGMDVTFGGIYNKDK